MSLTIPHNQYLASSSCWSRARDVLAGEDAVKAAGSIYLPRLETQTDQEYDAYKTRALFFNATARTAEGYLGLIFRRLPFFKLPDGKSVLAKNFSAFRADADLRGTTFDAYAKHVVNEVIAVGRGGSLIDFESEGETRAFVKFYTAEQILNWRVGRIKGRTVPTLIVLSESATTEHDEFDLEAALNAKSRTQLRVLRLVPTSSIFSTHTSRERGAIETEMRSLSTTEAASGSSFFPLSAYSGGVGQGEEVLSRSINHHQSTNHVSSTYRCLIQLFQKFTNEDGKEEWRVIDTKVPTRSGHDLPFIPFVFHGPSHSLPDVQKLPLQDLISVNLDHYRMDADYKHGMHYTALPTAWVSGFDRTTKLRIGSSTAWVAEAQGATAGFLEFKGQGLSTFERAMEHAEKQMAILGSRLLEGQKKVGEAAQAIELRQSGENSILSSLAGSVSQSLTQILRFVYWWHTFERSPEDIGSDKVLVELNTDFSTTGMDPQELTAVVSAWQANAISRETMTDLFRRGEVLPEGRTTEEEIAAIEKSNESRSDPNHNSLSAHGSGTKGEVNPVLQHQINQSSTKNHQPKGPPSRRDGLSPPYRS